MKEIYRLFETYTGAKALDIIELTTSGSNRKYVRVVGEDAILIGVIGTSVPENKAFWEISKSLSAENIPVPKVLAHNQEFTHYLQEDLGDISLFDSISTGRASGDYNPSEKKLLRSSIALLPKIQFEGGKSIDFSRCYPHHEFNYRLVSYDLNYFKYCFLKASGVDFDENKLEDDFGKISEVLLASESNTFMYRDFQARNIMLKEGLPYFIDFQGGFRGPIYYDLASFVWQAKANYSAELKAELIDTYLEALSGYMEVDREAFFNQLRHFALFRTLQVLGAYGFRGNFERKPHFLQSVPFAINNIKELLKTPFTEYPYLSQVLRQLIQKNEPLDKTVGKPKRKTTDKLHIKIYSFSYKKGIPEDNSGNGGGYVFDCRSIDNPGRYEPYFNITGMDKEVVDFLEKGGEAYRFLENIYPLAETHINEYIRRGFTNLMFSFGCTGGQHRSVYCAERLADYISGKFDVKLNLTHREQNVEKQY